MPSLPPAAPATLPVEPAPKSDADRALIEAIASANVQGVRDALDQGAAVNRRDESRRGQSPLAQSAIYLAPHEKTTAIQTMLLDAGANVHQIDDHGVSVLDHATLFDHWDLACRLLDAGAQTYPVEQVSRAIPPMARALVAHQLPLVHRLMNNGGSVPHRWGRDSMLVSVLQKADASPLNDQELAGLTGLMLDHLPPPSVADLSKAMLAVIQGLDAPLTVARLLAAGASVAPSMDQHDTFWPINGDDTNPEAVSVWGWTALHEAVAQDRPATVDVLLAAGAAPLLVTVPGPEGRGRVVSAVDVGRLLRKDAMASRLERQVLLNDTGLNAPLPAGPKGRHRL